jgi:hypothetical protein
MQERRGLVRLKTRLDATFAVLPDGAAQRTLTKDIGTAGACHRKPLARHPGAGRRIAWPRGPVAAIAEVVRSAEFETTGRTEHRRSAEISVRMVEIAPQDVEVLSRFVAAGLQAGAA